jgi:hypothetical protein
MPIRSFLDGKSFDFETLEIMNAAFAGVCADLGVYDKADEACGIVAKRVIELTRGQRDPDAIRKAVLASIKAG